MYWPFLLVSDRWWNPCADVQRLNPGLTSPRISSCRDFPIVEYCYLRPYADTHQWSFKGKCCLIQIDQHFCYFYCICKFLFFGLSKTLYQIIISTINFDALFKFQNLLHIPLTPLCSFYLVHWHCLLKHRRLWTNQKKGC